MLPVVEVGEMGTTTTANTAAVEEVAVRARRVDVAVMETTMTTGAKANAVVVAVTSVAAVEGLGASEVPPEPQVVRESRHRLR